MPVLRSGGRTALDLIISFRVEAEKRSESDHYYAKNYAVPHEWRQTVTAEVAQEEGDDHGADEAADNDSDHDGQTHAGGNAALFVNVPGLLRDSARDGRRR